LVDIADTLKFQVHDLGCIDYQTAYEYQMNCVNEVIKNADHQHIILCEHHSVITLGRMATKKHLLIPENRLHEQDIDIHTIDRGGDITLHCPGQLVAYPIFHLKNYGKDLHRYLHQLEQVAIDLLAEFGIVAIRFSSRTGVWVGREKIVSIGIGVKKWVTYHGIGINVNPQLRLFSLIQPCGFDVQMTSMEKIKHHPLDLHIVKQKLLNQFDRTFHAVDQ